MSEEVKQLLLWLEKEQERSEGEARIFAKHEDIEGSNKAKGESKAYAHTYLYIKAKFK